MCKKTNGWTNYPTWSVGLYADGLSEMTPEEIKENVEALIPDIKNMLMKDILEWALEKINYEELSGK
jgi:hypothetical protein